MQQLILHKKLYQIRQIDEENYSEIVYKRKEKLDLLQQMIREGCSEKTALLALKVSRAAVYRWKKRYNIYGLFGLENESRSPNRKREKTWTREIQQRIYTLRKEFPLWGKYKIAVMYKRRYGTSISASMTGRIISAFLKRGSIKTVAFLCGKNQTRPRIFNNHAKRLPTNMKAQKIGELLQIDHTTVRMHTGGFVKHFKVTCPITKISKEHVYMKATSKNAAHFLSYIQQKLPFIIQSLQVDGGSEFMADFETACKKAGIALFVLPPRSPELNGCIERSNSTIKREFYSQYTGPFTLDAIQAALEKFGLFYNTIRPHQALQYLTPWQYYKRHNQSGALQSHM